MTSHDKSINFEEIFERDETINNSHVECVIDTGEICSFLNLNATEIIQNATK